VGLILETGEPRDVHHFAALIGYGAGTINPYLVFETLVDMERDGYLPEGLDAQTAEAKFIKAINKGLMKIFSKMGISTVQSYCGAQIFEAIGLSRTLVDKYFTGTASRIGGIGVREIGEETLRRHAQAYTPAPIRQLDFGGEIHYRVQGEHHNWNPETISKLQHATRSNDPRSYAEFSQLVNDESQRRSVERRAVDDQVADHRERRRPPRLDRDHISVAVGAHVQLARGRARPGPVRAAVDHQSAGSADPLAAGALQRDRLLAPLGELLVQQVQHLEEAHVLVDAVHLVRLEPAGGLRGRLAPDPQRELHPPVSYL
jgi:glutamate synthase domain-containing protein 2